MGGDNNQQIYLVSLFIKETLLLERLLGFPIENWTELSKIFSTYCIYTKLKKKIPQIGSSPGLSDNCSNRQTVAGLSEILLPNFLIITPFIIITNV